MKFNSGVLWTILGNGMGSGAIWIVLLLLTNLAGFSVSGQYTLALSIVTPIFILGGMSLRAVFSSNTLRIDYSYYRVFRYYSSLLSLFLSILISVCVFEYNSQLLLWVFLMCALRAIEFEGDIYYCVPYSQHRNDIIGRNIFIKGFIFSSIFIVCYASTNKHFLSFSLALIFILIRTVFYERKLIGAQPVLTVNHFLNFKVLKSLLFLAVPLGIASFIISFTNNIPRYFVDISLGREMQAIYSSIAYIVTLGQLPITALGIAFRPKFFEYYTLGNVKGFYKLLNLGLLLSLCLGGSLTIISYVLGESILVFLYGIEMEGYNWIFIVASINAIFLYAGSFLLLVSTTLGNYQIGLILSFSSLVGSLFFNTYFVYYMKNGIEFSFLSQGIVGFILSFSLIYIFLKIRKISAVSPSLLIRASRRT